MNNGDTAGFRIRIAVQMAFFGSVVLFLPVLLIAALLARFVRLLSGRRSGNKLRLVWVGPPLLSIKTASAALREQGYQSIAIANERYKTAEDSDFDFCIAPRRTYPFGFYTLIYTVKASLAFVHTMFARDVLHSFFSGGFLDRTPLSKWEWRLWKLAGGWLVLMPFGSDSFVYSQLPDTPWAKALQRAYPMDARSEQKVAEQIDRGCRYADTIIGCLVHHVCLPRIDEWCLLWYPFDQEITPVYPEPGRIIRIAHATNHRKIKGTDHIETAVASLVEKGYPIELVVVEGKSHSDALAAFREADIVVDQLYFGYALAALEGMALGKPVVSGLSADPIYDPFRERKMLDHCAVLAATPETIEQILEDLILAPDRLNAIGRASRRYAEQTHGNVKTAELFSGIYRRLPNPRAQ